MKHLQRRREEYRVTQHNCSLVAHIFFFSSTMTPPYVDKINCMAKTSDKCESAKVLHGTKGNEWF